MRRTSEELEPGATTLDYVCAWIESGKTLVELTAEISEESDLEIGRMAITTYLKQTYGEEYDKRLRAARRESSFGLVDEAQSIVDAAPIDRDQIQKAKMRADVRLWMAERFNREELGGNKGVNVTVNVAQLHIDAMRARALKSSTSNTPAPAFSGVAIEPQSLPAGEGSSSPDDIAGDIAVDYEIVSGSGVES